MMNRLKTKLSIVAASLFGIAAIGVIDFITGTEIRVFPLYFLPIILSAWYLGKPGAVWASVAATIVWIASMYFGGRSYSHWSIWTINFFTQGIAFLVVAMLVAKVREALLRERNLSRTDPLTGLANSRAFYEQARGILALCNRNSRPATLAYVDLDNFKRVNDSLGHQQGDALLRDVAAVFSECLRSSDIPARIGGDEFIILLPETGAGEAHAALEKIRLRLAQDPRFQHCAVTVSIGAVAYAHAPDDLDGMVKAADSLMYEVKGASKNNVRIERGESRSEVSNRNDL